MLFGKVFTVISLVLSLLIVGNPDNFKTYVEGNVTTETTQITVIGENKTFNSIGNPRVRSIEQLQGDSWVTIGAYECFTEEYSTYHVFSTFKDTVNFNGMGMSDTLGKGEYRVVITFSLENRQGGDYTTYAYFTVTD